MHFIRYGNIKRYTICDGNTDCFKGNDYASESTLLIQTVCTEGTGPMEQNKVITCSMMNSNQKNQMQCSFINKQPTEVI